MADVENQQDSSFPVNKRKSDLYCQDLNNVANKAQKLTPSSNSADSDSKDAEINGIGLGILNSSTEENIGTESSISPEKAAASVSDKDANGVASDLGAEEEQEDEEEQETEEDEEEEEDNLIGAVTGIDRKGKCISREDKGKGKLIQVDESDDSDDDDDDDEDDEGFDEDDESDFSDDPLAEVDLDNILPSRTRRRLIQPGVYISNEISNRGEGDDSSDDSDA